MRRALAVLLLVVAQVACARGQGDQGPPVLIGTTTTTQDTGIIDVLVPAFEARTGHRAKFVVGGTGQTLQAASRGDVDVVLVHSPPDELAFVRSGDGIDRRLVMHNDFIVLGPASDPAHLKGKDARSAFAAIFAAGAPFISRGDRSGTNVRELSLWQAAGVDPKGKPWYVESSAGQLQTMQLASQRNAYVFADRGTWLANRAVVDLAVLVEGGADLLNIYHVILVNPATHPKVNAAGAKDFADYLVSPDGQRLIASFGADRFGRPLFTADAGKDEGDLR